MKLDSEGILKNSCASELSVNQEDSNAAEFRNHTGKMTHHALLRTPNVKERAAPWNKVHFQCKAEHRCKAWLLVHSSTYEPITPYDVHHTIYF